jgi:hypothetical protein
MLDRRSFLKSVWPIGAAIIAPTLAETLAVSAKKYFFLSSNPLAPLSLDGLGWWSYYSSSGQWIGMSRTTLVNIGAPVYDFNGKEIPAYGG